MAKAPIAIAPITTPAAASPKTAKPIRAADFDERFVSMPSILPPQISASTITRSQ
jgi:hypothetical protein